MGNVTVHVNVKTSDNTDKKNDITERVWKFESSNRLSVSPGR